MTNINSGTNGTNGTNGAEAKAGRARAPKGAEAGKVKPEAGKVGTEAGSAEAGTEAGKPEGFNAAHIAATLRNAEREAGKLTREVLKANAEAARAKVWDALTEAEREAVQAELDAEAKAEAESNAKWEAKWKVSDSEDKLSAIVRDEVEKMRKVNAYAHKAVELMKNGTGIIQMALSMKHMGFGVREVFVHERTGAVYINFSVFGTKETGEGTVKKVINTGRKVSYLFRFTVTPKWQGTNESGHDVYADVWEAEQMKKSEYESAKYSATSDLPSNIRKLIKLEAKEKEEKKVVMSKRQAAQAVLYRSMFGVEALKDIDLDSHLNPKPEAEAEAEAESVGEAVESIPA